MDRGNTIGVLNARALSTIEILLGQDNELHGSRITIAMASEYNGLRHQVYELDNSCEPLLPAWVDPASPETLPTVLELCALLKGLCCILERL